MSTGFGGLKSISLLKEWNWKVEELLTMLVTINDDKISCAKPADLWYNILSE